jgi:hypothetical protein
MLASVPAALLKNGKPPSPLYGGRAVLGPSWRQPFGVAEETRTHTFVAPAFYRVCLCRRMMWMARETVSSGTERVNGSLIESNSPPSIERQPAVVADPGLERSGFRRPWPQRP